MSWIESHVELGEHPKLTELCFYLAIEKYEAVGHLHLLWHFTLKYAWRDGDLRRFTPRVICEAVGWKKEPETFINALRQTGWIEKDGMQVHDWLSYAGKLVKDRLYNEIRRNTPLNAVKSRKTTATLPYPTLPNQKNKDMLTPFNTFWELYPRKTAKQPALKAWSRIRFEEGLFEKVVAAVVAQKDSKQWREGFIPHAATWLNQKRWDDEVQPVKQETPWDQVKLPTSAKN